jgi:carbamoyl-phosphate synthase small subunit
MLRESSIPAIAGVDTRALARHLRSHGSLRAIVTAPGQTDLEEARELARAVTRWEDQDFVAAVSPAAARDEGDPSEGGPLVAILDFGLKTNIVRSLRRRGVRVRILPHTATAAEALAPDVDGVVFSPGPGDPARLDGPVALAKAVIRDGRPLLGICLGHQVIGRAAGASTRRLPFGHHAANHPVQDLETGLVQVTAQNHEVTVIADTLPEASGFVVSQIDLNDGSVEGLRHRSLPIETVQYHPEGGPGPLDALAVFDRFVRAARARHGGGEPEPTVGAVEPLHLDTAELQRRLQGMS